MPRASLRGGKGMLAFRAAEENQCGARLGARQERDAGVGDQVHRARQRVVEGRPARPALKLGGRVEQGRAAARAAACAGGALRPQRPSEPYPLCWTRKSRQGPMSQPQAARPPYR